MIQAGRLWDDLMALAAMTDPAQPYSRCAFSPLFVQGRQFLAQRFAQAGLSVSLDAGGNLIGCLPGREPGLGVLMIGSHSDTVPGGGRFDGVAGVIAALEIARALAEHHGPLCHDLAIVDFLAEEPGAFGGSCIGSRAMAGCLDATMLASTHPSGETLAQAIERVGGSPAQLTANGRDDIRAFFELHIEQGPVLERESVAIGLVSSIVAIRRLSLTFMGQADHAGTTPMALRQDAAVAACEATLTVRQLAETLAATGLDYFVATTGVIDVQPNAANVVPATARLVIDSRSDNPAVLDQFLAELQTAAQRIAARYSVETAGPVVLSDSRPAGCDPALRKLLADAADDRGLTHREMVSGAGHDAAFMARIAPSAMVFVPCRSGKSHAAEEWAEPQALADGATVIAQALLRFDRLRQ